MTQEAYREMHGIDIPIMGKHCKKLYHVWVVLGPAGPAQEYDIWGLEEAKQSVQGAWDYEITRVLDGVLM